MGLSSPHSIRFSSTHWREIRLCATDSGTGSPVKLGESKALIPMVCHRESGLQTLAKYEEESSGFPIAKTRQSSFVVSESMAYHNCSGIPQASSNTTSTR